MMMKQENDRMRDNLEFLYQGGDPKKLQQEELEKLGLTPGGFKTPRIDN